MSQLSKEQNMLINEYLPDRTLREKLFDYLLRHEEVGPEVFSYLGETEIDEYMFSPIPKETFIKRLPFYFYKNEESIEKMGRLRDYYFLVIRNNQRDQDLKQELEKLYLTLEKLFYYYKIDLVTIFNYPRKVGKYEILYDWIAYLELAEQFDVLEQTPENLIVEYNYLLERAGREPIIYELHEQFIAEYISRNGKILRLEGIFPCDKNNYPILKWIGVKIKNAAKIWVEVDERFKGSMFIEITPKTQVWGLNCWGTNEDGSDCWYDLYTGPLLMEFDYEAIKTERLTQKLTQKEIADSIGASVRTYQKWESGETTPDGHYLLRLMNVLNITEINQLIKIHDVE